VEAIGDLIALVFGVGLALVIGIPLVSFMIVAAVTLFALQIAIVVAIVGYIVGIPWSIYFRVRHGRWPES